MADYTHTIDRWDEATGENLIETASPFDQVVHADRHQPFAEREIWNFDPRADRTTAPLCGCWQLGSLSPTSRSRPLSASQTPPVSCRRERGQALPGARSCRAAR